jgi:hypothetical protein
MDWLERHSCWRLGHRDDWSRAPPHRAIRDCLGPQKRDRSPSRGAGGEPSHRRDRAGEPCCQGPGPRQQKHQWVPTWGPRVLANQGATLLMLIPSQTCAVRGGFIPKPASSHTPKPFPWEMAPATHLFVSPDRVVLGSPFLATAGPSHHAAPPITLPAKDTFDMHSLLHAIPDPMLVEATLPPPSLQTHCLAGHITIPAQMPSPPWSSAGMILCQPPIVPLQPRSTLTRSCGYPTTHSMALMGHLFSAQK